MSNNLGEAGLLLYADTARLQSDMGKAAHIVQTNTEAMQTRAVAMGTAIGNGITAGIEVAFKALESLAHFVEHTVESTVQLAHLAEKTGITAQALGGLRLAATESGVDMDRLGKTLTKVAGIQFDSAAGSKKAAAEMKFFGITARDTADTATDKLLKSFNALPPSFDRAGLAVKIFGQRIGTDFLLVADKAKGGLSGLEQQAADLGVSLSESTLKAAEHFEISMGIIKLQAQSVGETIISGLLPTLDEFIKKLADPAINAEFKEIAASGVGAFVQIIEWAGKATAAIAGVAQSTAAERYGAAVGDRPRLEDENARISSRLSKITPERVNGFTNTHIAFARRLFTDPYALAQTGNFFQGSVPLDQERAILTKKLAQNKTYLAQTGLLEKQAADAHAAAAAATAAADKSSAATTAKTQADYQKLLAALSPGSKGHKAHTAAVKDLTGAYEQFQNTLGRLQGFLDGPLKKAEEQHNKNVRDLNDQAKKAKVGHDELAAALAVESQAYAKEVENIKSRYASEVSALLGPVARAQDQHRLALREVDRLQREGAISSGDLAAALKEEAKAFNQATIAAQRAVDPLKTLLSDMQRDVDLIGMSNAERTVANELMVEGIALYGKEGQAALAQARMIEQLGAERQKNVQFMDNFRSSLADLGVTAVTNFGSIGKSFKKMMDDLAQQIERRIIENWIAKAFGQQGSTGQGTSGGGGLGSFIGRLFGGGGSSGSAPAASSSSGGGFWSTIATWAGSLFGGGHANGGPVSPGMFYEVGEGNKPEMLNMGGHSYLLPGNNGQVTPMRGGGGLSQVLNFNYAAPYDARTESQKNSRLAFETRRAMARNG
jgi:hypothetical protein